MLRVILAVLAVCLFAGDAFAQNYRQAGDWIVRAGLGVVAPDGDGTDVSAGNALGLPAGTVDVDDGYAATRKIRDLEGSDWHTPIIAMTAGAMEQDRDQCLEAGMDDFLTKPVTAARLTEMVDRWTAAAVDAQPPSAL